MRSVSRKGYSPDNAACEGCFGRLKTELFYPRNWQSTTIEQFIQALDAYIRCNNEKRIKISLGSLSQSSTAGALESLLNQFKISAAPPNSKARRGSRL